MRYGSLVIFVSCLSGWWSSTAAADHRADVRVIVLRSNAPDGPLTDRVDRALITSLAADAGFGRAELSPVLLPDIGLAAGCDDRSRRCLNRIAGTVDADVVIVRDLQMEDDRPILALTSFDSLGVGAPIYLERTIEREPNEEVSEMVRQLYALDEEPAGSSEVLVLPSSATPPDRAVAEDSGGVSALTWVTLGAGAAALGAGAVFGALSADAHELYARTPVHSEAQADRARDRLETAEDRALAANIFFGAGGALLAIGATLLVLDLTATDDGDRLSLSASATPDGGLLVLRGSTEAW